MPDLVVTGASRGIGRALALSLAGCGQRLVVVARDRARLDEVVAGVASRGGAALAVPGDLGSLAGARDLGGRLSELLEPGATLVHNAGLWPARRVLTPDGLEQAFVVNHLGPFAMQRALLEGHKLRRIMTVSAALIALGRVDARRTPRGDDFSRLRTYCSTKLWFALSTREVARSHPEIDVVALHPGVVRTDLGVQPGWRGWLLSLGKHALESPESCAARLARILGRERWSPPGAACWLMKESDRPWPARARDEAAQREVTEATAALLSAQP